MSDSPGLAEGGGVRYRLTADISGAVAGLTAGQALLRQTGAVGVTSLRSIDAAQMGLTRGLRGNFGATLRATRSEMDALGRTGATMGTRLSSGLGVLAGGMLVMGAIRGVQEISRAYKEFDDSMHLMWTNLPNMSQAAFDKVSVQAQNFAQNHALLANDVATALYDVTSVGFDPDKAMQKGGILNVASDTALAGDASLPDTTKAIITTLNTYGLTADDAAMVSDKLFVAVRDGDVRFSDLAQTLSTLTPIAAQTGVGLDDVSASVATLTKMGFTAGETMTNMRMAFSELSKPSFKAGQFFVDASGGQTFQQYIADGHSVIDAMALIKKHMGETGKSAVEVFTRIQGAQAFMALSSQTGSKMYAQSLYNAQHAEGVYEAAAKKMRSSTAYASKQAAADWDKFKVSTGAAFAPVIRDLATLSSAIAKVMSNETVRKTAEAALMLGTAAFAVSKLTAAYKALTATTIIQRLGALAAANQAVAASSVAAGGVGGMAGVAGGAAGGAAAAAARERAAMARLMSQRAQSGLFSNAGMAASMAAGGLGVGGVQRAAAAEAAAARKAAIAGVTGAMVSAASKTAMLVAAAGAADVAYLTYKSATDVDTNDALHRGMDGVGADGHAGLMNYAHRAWGQLEMLPGLGGSQASADYMTGYSGFKALGDTEARDENGTTALERATAQHEARVRLDELTAKQKSIGLTKDEEQEMLGIVSIYGEMAEAGEKVSDNIKDQVEAQTTLMQQVTKLGDAWRGSFNMFDESPVVVNRQKAIKDANDDLAKATDKVKDAEADLAKFRKAGAGGASDSQLLSARAGVQSAQAAMDKLRRSGTASPAALEAAASRVAAAQARYNELVQQGGIDTQKLNEYESKLAAARKERASAQDALNEAKKPQGLSIAELTKRETDQFKYRMGQVGDIQALFKAGMDTTALNELYAMEANAPGTLHRVAKNINTKFGREFIKTMNEQAEILQTDGKDIVGKALAGIASQAVVESQGKRTKASKHAGMLDGASYAEGWQEALHNLMPSLFGASAAHGIGGITDPGAGTGSGGSGGSQRAITINGGLHNHGVQDMDGLSRSLDGKARKYALGRSN